MELVETFEKTITENDIERWRYPRFFSGNIADTAVITGDDAKHIATVLRMKSGEKAIVCDNNGTDYLCRIITADKNVVELEILDSQPNKAEASIKLRLFQCLPKSDKMDFIAQKATELGACEIIPVLSARCVSRPDDKSMGNKLARYQKIVDEAAKQCGRGRIPTISPLITLDEAIKSFDRAHNGIIFYECGGEPLKKIVSELHGNVLDVFIGSEGGFEQREVDAAIAAGIVPATLGARILRCETAPIAAISVLMNLTDNL